jgi:hypothetical protein
MSSRDAALLLALLAGLAGPLTTPAWGQPSTPAIPPAPQPVPPPPRPQPQATPQQPPPPSPPPHQSSVPPECRVSTPTDATRAAPHCDSFTGRR